jgi:DNA-binding MarR family transcriptional regulator
VALIAPSALQYEALLRLLRAANVIWESSRVFFEQWELSPTQFNVLNLLDAHPGGLSQTELGRQLLTHRSNITGLVDRLGKRGLVERKSSSTDRRVYRVVLTFRGRKLLQRVLPQYYKEAGHVWDGVSDTRIGGLLTALDQVTNNAAKAATRVSASTKEKPR